MNLGRGLWNITGIGLAAMFFIVLNKLIFSKWYVPGYSDLVAMA